LVAARQPAVQIRPAKIGGYTDQQRFFLALARLKHENPTGLSGSDPGAGSSARKVESAALQLLAAITPAEHEVSVVQEHLGDAVGFDDASVDLVGISAMTIQARRAYEIADSHRRAGPT
jgi:hypothetical protein